jgi:hypothetical protein
MVGNLRICYENDVDAGSISASSSVSSLPAVHVKDFDIQKIWRASALSASLTVDIGSTLTLEVVAAINTNSTQSSTFQVRASVTDPAALSSLTYDSGPLGGVDPVYSNFIHFLPTQVSYRYLRMDITNTTNNPEVGRWMSGQAYAPSRHQSLISPPESIWRDPSRRTYSLGQNVFVDVLSPQRGYRFTLRGLTDAEKISNIDELNRLRSTNKDILICIDDQSANLGRDSIWGLLEQPARAERMPGSVNTWNVEIEIYERL